MDEQFVPSVSIDFKDFPQKDRFTVWRDLMADVFDIEPLPGHGEDCYARGRAFDLGATVLSEWIHTPIIIRGDRNQSVLQREEFLVLSRNPRGHQAGLIDDVSFEKKEKQLVVYDLESTIHTETVASHAQEFALPYSEIGYDPSKHSSFLYLGQNTPISRIIDCTFDSLFELIPQCTPEEAKQLSDGFCGLLRGVISQNFRDESVRYHFARAREAAARRFVRKELKNPNLTVDHVCKEIGLSRAALYRIFEPDGGFHKAVSKMRLDGALAELSHMSSKPGVILRVARNWTFFDQAYFSRVFKEAFGFRPSDALGVGLVGTDKTPCANESGSLRFVPEERRLADLYAVDTADNVATDEERQTSLRAG